MMTFISWGKQLMELHLNYETITPYPLKIQKSDFSTPLKVKLKADKIKGKIRLDIVNEMRQKNEL